MARGHILVVDDETALLQVFADYFEEKGFSVDTAADAYQALEKAVLAPYDLVILDLKMPGMDGMEALGKLKGMQPRAKFILITGYWDEVRYLREEIEKAGVFQVVEKPFEMSEMLDLVEKALSAG